MLSHCQGGTLRDWRFVAKVRIEKKSYHTSLSTITNRNLKDRGEISVTAADIQRCTKHLLGK